MPLSAELSLGWRMASPGCAVHSSPVTSFAMRVASAVAQTSDLSTHSLRLRTEGVDVICKEGTSRHLAS